MAEYIEREELVRQIICNMAEFIGAPDDVQKHDEQCNYAINMIEGAPVADVAPVVHGRWITDGNGYHWTYNCSICAWKDGYPFNERHNFCPNCGAKMDGANR